MTDKYLSDLKQTLSIANDNVMTADQLIANLLQDIANGETAEASRRNGNGHKDETNMNFRTFRAWKRGRNVLHHVNVERNLAHFALDAGYPDSTHFSHSLRRIYGLQPSAIFSGSRRLQIISGRDVANEVIGMRA